ncbi:MAG: xanthine dehydrogenase family protein molybdopterin-binding subunit [Candidatus Rokuibacteriota bacterium]|nr:MAG: xanthine dehydrogenase family protein molybdopterin-binding subunit [Candidatus Rokubacteria bacterium]
MARRIDRRDFIKTTTVAGVGLTLSFTLPGVGVRTAAALSAWEPNTQMTLTPDGLVTVHIFKAEMGQGVGTALAQIVAEELEVDWKDIRIDYPTSDPKHGLMITGGSWSVNWTFDKLSRAAVAARTMLIAAAAQQWKVPASECVAERSTVRHAPTGRFLTYGQIVDKVPIAAQTWSEDDLKKLTLKKPEEYRVVGHWAARLDIPEKVNGKAKFGIDTFLPGMVYAKVAYPPTREGAKVKAVDDKAAKGVKGYVKTVVAGDLVAALGTTYEAATQARDALKVTWDNGPNAAVSTESITRDYEQKAKEDMTSPAWVEKGDVKGALGKASKTHEATYVTDYVAHAPLEPMNCVAKFEGGVADIYTGCQFQTMAMGAISKQLGIKEDKVRVHQHYLGGGFGRRLEPDAIVEAVVIAREAGKPVKLIRSREEDFKRDYFRSFTLQRLRGGLDAEGKLTAWDNTLVAAYPGERYAGLDDKGRDQFALNGADHVYDIPNQFVRAIRKETGISVGYVRAVAPNYTFFAVETFIDELAQLAKVDAVQFRLGMLKDAPRLANVLKMVADRAGWGKPLPANTGLGIACVTAQEKKDPTWTASAIQARVDPQSGKVTVEKVVCAVDCGIIVNPDGARSQVEGSLLFGISNALKERITIENGQPVQSNFHDYHLLRMNEVPDVVEVHFVKSKEYPTGLGEPGTTTVAPALSNAIFAATGARVRSVPFLPDRVLAALKAKA